MAAKAPGEFIEVSAHAVFALLECQAEAGIVVARFRKLGCCLFDEPRDGGVTGVSVQMLLANLAEVDQPCLLELRECHRDTALPHAENFL